jgi:cytochrome c553
MPRPGLPEPGKTMMNRIPVALSGVVLALSFAALPAVAWGADIAAGKKLASQRCAMCHGVDGIAKMPIAPHLAGESETYLQGQLKDFRSGKRQSEMMSVVAKNLTDEQIANVAAWYSVIKISVTLPE